MRSIAAALAALSLTACAATTTSNDGGRYAVALADPARPAADVARDAARKPAQLLALAEIGEGDKVADFIMGGGYFTRIMAKAVGDSGRVYAYQPAEFIGFRAAYGDEQRAASSPYSNVTPLSNSLGAVAFPEPLDAVVTVQNWHDLHLKIAPPTLAGDVARKLYAALKPGGVLLVVDHAAAAGSGVTAADTLHRIEPAAARAEIEAAGFRLERESSLYANAGDPRTALVFDPAIRGKTDQFIYKFRKPR